MSVCAVMGSQWGDEGKGKITDFLAQKSDYVVRYQGGNNAGHTIVFDGKKFALRSVPSGIFSKHIINVISNGVVLNLKSFIEELDELEKKGITEYQIRISDKCNLIMPYHILLDGASENLKGNKKIGTTKRGIGPTYTDKASRIALRAGDLLEPAYFKERLHDALIIKNKELEMYGIDPLNEEDIYNEFMGYAQRVKDYICDTSVLLNNALKENKKVLFEGAQGAMLCIENGTFPYVTSSSPLASAIPLYAGIPANKVDNVLGIIKAYTTRVGEGPFPTELFNNIGDEIREKGHEYGTVTKRPRRVGWLDLVVIKNTIRLAGVNNLALMLFDVLSGFDELKVCTHYELDGNIIDYEPGCLAKFERAKPVYKTLKGFKGDITNVKSFDELPQEAKDYINFIEKETGVDVAMFSVGPDRLQTIIRKEVF